MSKPAPKIYTVENCTPSGREFILRLIPSAMARCAEAVQPGKRVRVTAGVAVPL